MSRKIQVLIPAVLVMISATYAAADPLTRAQTDLLGRAASAAGVLSDVYRLDTPSTPNSGFEVRISFDTPDCGDWTFQTQTNTRENSEHHTFQFLEPGTTGSSGMRLINISEHIGDSLYDRTIGASMDAIAAYTDPNTIGRGRRAWRESLTGAQRNRVEQLYRLYGEAREAARAGDFEATRTGFDAMRTACRARIIHSCPVGDSL